MTGVQNGRMMMKTNWSTWVSCLWLCPHCQGPPVTECPNCTVVLEPWTVNKICVMNPLPKGRKRGRGRWVAWTYSLCLPSPRVVAFPLSERDDKILLFWISDTGMVFLSFQAKIPTESACGMKVLISFGDFRLEIWAWAGKCISQLRQGRVFLQC